MRIPMDTADPDYMAYLDQLAAGYTPLPPAPGQAIAPCAVTMRQARLALLGAGLLDGVNASLAAMPGPEGEAARIEWEYATEVVRGSALVQGLAASLGLDDAMLDALFVAGGAL